MIVIIKYSTHAAAIPPRPIRLDVGGWSGTTEKMASWLAAARPDLRFPVPGVETPDVHVAYCPERVLPGQVVRELVSNDRIIGGSGTDAASRLGLQPDAPYDGPRAAFAAAQRWRRRADHPLNDPFTTRTCRAAVRSAEALVAEYAARGR